MDRILAELENRPQDAEDRRAALYAYYKACDTLGIKDAGRAVRKVWRWTQRATAVLFIPLLAGLAYALFFKAEPADSKWAELVVPDMQTQELVLPDGSKLVVNAGSRVTYPDSFNGGTREVFLDGEVQADIATDPEHPFIIHSGNLAVKVYGTKFNFKTYSKSDYAEVLLTEGSISLDAQTGAGLRTVPMKPGEFVQYCRSTEIIEKSSLDENSIALLSDNRTLKFRDIPLNEIASELGRRFGEEVVVCSPALAETKLFAIYSNGETLEEILSNITVSLSGARLIHNGKVWMIDSK